MNRRLTATLLSAACAVLPLASLPSAPVHAQSVMRPSQDIVLSVGRGQLVTVPGNMADIFVANESIADVQVKSARQLYVFGKSGGETTLYASNAAGDVIWSANIRVGSNIDSIDQMLALAMPDAKVSIATMGTNTVLLTGTVAAPEDAAEAERLVKAFVGDQANVISRLKMATPLQVNLQVRIAEVARNVDRQLGIRWGAIGLTSGGSNTATFGFVGGARGAEPGSYGANFSYNGPKLNVDVTLKALSEEGLVNILAEPNLTARSGEPARFLAGGEYPYAVANDDENTIQFKDYGVSLGFTPTVLDGNRISLNVKTEVSELDFKNSITIPSLKTRRAETTVDLGSGQSFAIAGLMQNSAVQNASKMPALGTLPVLGALFRSTEFRRGQTELVIIVTPVIVRPVSAGRIATPVDTYVPPTDVERILMGRFQGTPKQQQLQNRLQKRRPVGQSGFVFE